MEVEGWKEMLMEANRERWRGQIEEKGEKKGSC